MTPPLPAPRDRRRLRAALWTALLAGGVLSLLGDLAPAQAQAPATAGALDTLVAAFQRVQGFEGALQRIAMDLFAGLAACELVVAFMRLGRRGADLPAIFGVVVERMVVIGFFWFVLLNGGAISRAIVDTLAIAGNDASAAIGGSRNMSPTDVFGVGMNIAQAIWAAVSIYNPAQSLLLAIGGLVALMALVAITAMLIEVIIEGYVIASAGVIFLGLGGSWWTRDIAVSVLKAALAVGAKRLFIQLLIGLTETMMRDMAAQTLAGRELNMAQLAVMIGVPVVLAYLCKTLPSRAQAIIQGAYVGGPGLSGEAERVAEAAATTAVAMASAGAAATAAFRTASAQIAAREAASGALSASSGGAGRAAAVAGQAARNLIGSGAADVGQRLTGGSAASGRGYAGARMTAAMNDTRGAAERVGAAAAAGQTPSPRDMAAARVTPPATPPQRRP